MRSENYFESTVDSYCNFLVLHFQSESDAFLQHLSSRYSKELNSPHHVVYQALLNIFKQQRSQTTLHIVVSKCLYAITLYIHYMSNVTRVH